jgi:hypothetical protein
VSGPLHTVHVRINDATGQPTPVRVRFVDARGQYLAPFGRLTHFATGFNGDLGGNVLIAGTPHAYIDGSCEIALPADPVTLTVSKGPEFTPLYHRTALGPGKMALRLAIERWTDLRSQGWYAGDCRAHFLSPHAALLEAAAEDLAVVNLLATELSLPDLDEADPARRRLFPAIPNILAFSGQRPALEMAGHMVVVNTHNWHPVLGRLALLNCHRTVYPLRFGRPDLDNWSLADWCDQCHRKGGLVVWTHSYLTRGEALADLVLGKVDALEIDSIGWEKHHWAPDWYRLLNCGVRVPLVGASGKHSNAVPLGAVRTYARLPPGEALSYKGWIEAIRAGRTFVTAGPLLSFTVNGQEPGATVELTGDAPAVQVRAEARSLAPFGRLELIVNGEPFAGVEPSGTPATAVLEGSVPLPASGWLAVRCLRPQPPTAYDVPPVVEAHTSPVYVRVAGRPQRPDPITLGYLLEQLDETAAWVQNEGRFETDRQRSQLVTILQRAREEIARRGPVE